jgi:hypothetical protein
LGETHEPAPTPIRVRLFPQPLEVSELEGFSSKDLLGRAELGQRLTNLLSVVLDPQVIALNGPWGSGKTTFLRMWAGELRKRGFPVIYFDAFENDYVDDAFAALARDLIELAESSGGKRKAMVRAFKEKAIDLGAYLLRSGTKLGLKMGTRVLTAGLASDTDIKAALEEAIDDSADAAQTYMRQLLDNPRRQKTLADSFRHALSSFAATVAPAASEGEQKPLIYIIDELDRCRPDFALSILERIKHFLSVDNVHFLFGVHQEQLETSVRYAYGPDIDATTYLSKFITLSITFDQPERRGADPLEIYATYLSRNIQATGEDVRSLELTNEFILRVARKRGLSLRTLERIFGNVSLAFALGGPRTLKLGPIVGGLCILKVVKPPLFSKAKRGTLTLDDVASFFDFQNPPNPDKHDLTWQQEWWEFCLGQDAEKHSNRANNLSFDYNLDRQEVVPYIANSVIERFGK